MSAVVGGRRLPSQGRMSMSLQEYDDYLDRLVAEAPPMTDETAAELRRLFLTPTTGGDSR